MTVRVTEVNLLASGDGNLVLFDSTRLKQALEVLGIDIDEFIDDAQGVKAKIDNSGALGVDKVYAVSRDGNVYDCMIVGAPEPATFERMLRDDELTPPVFNQKMRSSDELYEHCKSEEALSDFIDKSYENYIKSGEIRKMPFNLLNRHNPDLDDVFMSEANTETN